MCRVTMEEVRRQEPGWDQGQPGAKTKKVNLGTLGKVRGRAVIKDR